ncbi:CARDB domain-containing protein [Hippea maritima]|uniref:Uncharacterized protein n=1 Tax=Hippea maritima (strain ATCC 700847 / DSM 10411 / MH2) TaxID=760142 RepID=F2LWI3_HIPMA|nr:CARDB domain-containing protein [Hippea maritima]AEA34092.1 hypothetical protein Hipma_1126 [Hippea maritima DSM 10411]
MNEKIFKSLWFLVLTLVFVGISSYSWAYKPDLRVEGIYLRPAVNNKCRIWIAIANRGGPISNAEFNRIVLSLLQDDVSKVRGSYMLKYLDRNETLKHPNSKVYVPWNAILLNPGLYKFGAKIDATNVVSESNENNNIMPPIRLRCRGGSTAALPDLTISGIRIGRYCRYVYVYVKNIGKAPLPNWVWTHHSPKNPGVYLYINGKKWGGKSIWKFDPSRKLQKPGGLAVFRAPIKRGSNNTIRILAVVDYWNKLRESNESNNRMEKSLKCSVALPDLTIKKIYLDNACRVNVLVKNAGKAPLPNWVWTHHSPKNPGVYLYINGKKWGGKSIWKFDPSRKLQKPGGYAIYKSSLKVGDAKTNILAVVDYWSKVKESTKSNNKKRVVLRCKSLPDLVVSSIGVDGECGVSVGISNIGSGTIPYKAFDKNNGVAIQMYNNNKPWGGIRLGVVDPHHKLSKPHSSIHFKWFPDANNLKLKPGENKIKIVVDANHVLKEYNENNNVKAKGIRCLPKSDVGLYGFVKIGKNKRQVEWNTSITLTPSDANRIKNGKPLFYVYFAYREYEGVSTPRFENEVLFGSEVVKTLWSPPLRPKQIRFVAVPIYLEPKNGELCFKIDAKNTVRESDETNNNGCVTLKFRGFEANLSTHGAVHTIKNKLKNNSLPGGYNVPKEKPNMVLPGETVK